MEDRVILENMPTSIKGYVFKDDDGAPVIVLNSRLSREQNQRTYEHERQHIERGEMDEPTYIEYGGAK